MIRTLAGHGVTYRINDPGSHIGQIIAETGQPYELKLLEDVYRHRRAGAVAVDVGAHVGNHSLWMSLVCGMEVHAYEADPANASALADNVALNDADVVVHNVALGDHPGWATLEGDPVYGTAVARYGHGNIPVLTLDSYQLRGVRVLKVDVEGNEPAVLRGAVATLRRWRPTVWAECADRDTADLAAVLKPLGYRVTRIYGATPMTVWEPR